MVVYPIGRPANLINIKNFYWHSEHAEGQKNNVFMAKIFRKMRLKLASEDKARRYLKYAFGELVLLVLGILIALQISNWNNENIELVKEQAVLLSLQKNFKYNLNEVRRINENTKVSYYAAAGLLELIKPGEATYSPQEVDSLLSALINFYTYDPATGTIDDIIKSGHLGLITNEDLKNKISNWSGIITDMNKDIKITNDHMFTPLLLFLMKHSNMQNSPLPPHLTENTGLQRDMKSNFPPNYDKLMTSLEFENLIDFHSVNLIYLSEEYNIVTHYLEECLVLLNSEIIQE